MKPWPAGGLLVLSLVCGCGGAPGGSPPAEAPLPIGPALVAPAPAPAAAEAGPPVPDGLQLLVRLNDPEVLVREVGQLLSQGAKIKPDEVLGALIGKRLVALVDPGQEIDVASVGTGAGLVVSFAVRPEAVPRLGEGRVLREASGLTHIAPDDDPANDRKHLTDCAFAAATGRASTRLVCATDAASLVAVAPYLARTVPAEPLDADARLTIPGPVLRERRGVGKAIGDAAGAKLGVALVERFVDEIDRLDIDLRLGPASVEPTFDLRLTGRTSMMARVLVPQSKPAPPPRAFYRMPIDALVALHAVGAPADDLAPLRAALGESLESSLVLDGYPSDRTHVIRERLEGLFLTGGPVVLAFGVGGGRAGAEKALDALDAAAGKPAEERLAEARVRAAIVPWMLAELEEPPERWTKGLREIVQRAEDAERARTVGAKSSTPRDPDGSHIDVRIGALDPKWSLPKDSLHLEVLIAPRRKGKRPTRKGHLLVAPKGASTWIGYSEDVAAVTTRLRTALDDATEVGTLAKSTEALALREASTTASGFGSLAGLELLVTSASSSAELQELAAAASRNGHVGGAGSEIVTWSVSAEPSPPSPHVTLRIPLTRPAALKLVRLFRW